MNVNLFAWVDIDEDEKLDIQDIATSDPAYDPDGDVVGDFIDSHQVIATQENLDYDDTKPSGPYNSPHIIVDENSDDIADTVPITETETPVVKETICDDPCSCGFWLGDVNSEGQRYWFCYHSYSPHSGWKDYYCEKIDMIDFKMDVCEQVGGKVLVADHCGPTYHGDWTNSFRWHNEKYQRYWDAQYCGDGWYRQKNYEYQTGKTGGCGYCPGIPFKK